MSESMPASPFWQAKRSSSDVAMVNIRHRLSHHVAVTLEWSVRFGLGRKFFVPPSEIIVLLYRLYWSRESYGRTCGRQPRGWLPDS